MTVSDTPVWARFSLLSPWMHGQKAASQRASREGKGLGRRLQAFTAVRASGPRGAGGVSGWLAMEEPLVAAAQCFV